MDQNVTKKEFEHQASSKTRKILAVSILLPYLMSIFSHIKCIKYNFPQKN